jgi:hypothetical protein
MRAFTLTPCRRCPGLATSALGPCGERNVSDPSVLSGRSSMNRSSGPPKTGTCGLTVRVRDHIFECGLLHGREHTQTQLLSQSSVL